MLQSIIAGLILAAVSGLTFLAYKHPKGFERLEKYLFWVVTVAFLATGSFIEGYASGFSAGNHKGSAAEQGDVVGTWFAWSCVIYMGALAFLLFLRFGLPSLTKTSGKDDADKDEPPKGKSS